LFHTNRRTDVQTDMTKQIVAFCNLANAPKTCCQHKFTKSTAEILGTAYVCKAGTTYFLFLKSKITSDCENIRQL
jgi:hypothetical protein